LYRSWPLFLWLKVLRQPPGGAVDRRKDWGRNRASSKPRWFSERLFGDLRPNVLISQDKC
jgi:hypothetical protein